MTAGTMQKSIPLYEVVTCAGHVPSENQQMPTHPVGTKHTSSQNRGALPTERLSAQPGFKRP